MWSMFPDFFQGLSFFVVFFFCYFGQILQRSWFFVVLVKNGVQASSQPRHTPPEVSLAGIPGWGSGIYDPPGRANSIRHRRDGEKEPDWPDGPTPIGALFLLGFGVSTVFLLLPLFGLFIDAFFRAV